MDSVRGSVLHHQQWPHPSLASMRILHSKVCSQKTPQNLTGFMVWLDKGQETQREIGSWVSSSWPSRVPEQWGAWRAGGTLGLGDRRVFSSQMLLWFHHQAQPGKLTDIQEQIFRKNCFTKREKQVSAYGSTQQSSEIKPISGSFLNESTSEKLE